MSRRSVTLEFRDEVINTLHEAGISQAETSRVKSRVRGASAAVAGIPDWTLLVRRQSTYELAETIRDAEELATENGDNLYAAVVYRRGHATDQAFAVMTVETLARVIRTLASGARSPIRRSA